MKIAILTSSRADYSIYLPLLKALKKDPFFEVSIIAFGTHLSSFHGHTADKIEEDGFKIEHRIEHTLTGDSAHAIATSMGLAFLKFADLWEKEKNTYDLVFCLGDRYEMFAAVSAAVPYQIKFAHLHGGETTLGAIDNEFRHSLTVFSKLHFTATEAYGKRVAAIKGSDENVYVVGSLSLENLKTIRKLSIEELAKKFSLPVSSPFILVTFHPETATGSNNKKNAEELIMALQNFRQYQVIITMPNADVTGNTMREVYQHFAASNDQIFLVENLGPEGYFSCMDLCSLVVGNSSSGIIEAASFGKYVVNIGDRQSGRVTSENIISCSTDADSIRKACEMGLEKGRYNGKNIYYKENVTKTIIEILKNVAGKPL